MWTLVINEFKYNRFMIAGFITLLPFLYLFESALEGLPHFLTMVLVNVLLIYFIMFQNRENRHIARALLPLSPRFIALARSMQITLLPVLLYAIYFLIGLLINLNNDLPYQPNLKTNFIQILYLMLFYHLFFLGRDVIIYPLHYNRFRPVSADQSKLILIVLALLLNVLGVYVHVSRPPWLIDFFDFLFGHVYTAGEVLLLGFACLSAILLSVWTYGRRRSYLDL